MADVPSLAKRIQIEETQFRGPVSESLASKLGGTMNYILDHYVISPGTVVDYFGSEASVPSGWDIPDGRERSRSGNWANLYAVAGPFCGTGDGATTWNLPDIRGATTRMVDTTSTGTKGRDPDTASRTLANPSAQPGDPGSYQSDDFKSHTHPFHVNSAGGPGGIFGSNSADVATNTTDATGGNETRMKNVLVMKIIKL